MDAEGVQVQYQIATLGRRDLEWAPDEYAGFAMTLLRMLAFIPGGIPADRVEPLGDAVRPAPRGREAPAISKIPASTLLADATAANEAETPPAVDKNSDCDWRGLAESLPGLVRQLAMQCELVSRTGTNFRLRLPEGQKALVASFGDKLRDALAEKLGTAVRIDIALTTESLASPAAARAREQAARQDEAETAIRDDLFIQTIVRECEATVTNIRPLATQARLTGTDN